MKVELDTYNNKVHVISNDAAASLEVIDEWIRTLRVARSWLKKNLEKKNG